jgi:hypothetical protein
VWYFRFHSAHFAKVLGVEKTVKTTEERRRLNTPSCRRGNHPRRNLNADDLLDKMAAMAHGGGDVGGRSGVLPLGSVAGGRRRRRGLRMGDGRRWRGEGRVSRGERDELVAVTSQAVGGGLVDMGADGLHQDWEGAAGLAFNIITIVNVYY